SAPSYRAGSIKSTPAGLPARQSLTECAPRRPHRTTPPPWRLKAGMSSRRVVRPRYVSTAPVPRALPPRSRTADVAILTILHLAYDILGMSASHRARRLEAASGRRI